ncbi:MAG TPA: hypothetical protein VNZ43_08170 [Sphingomonadaceae bacterium]|nr:hypothetical protein [Sphingomonadaceae bacterium]
MVRTATPDGIEHMLMLILLGAERADSLVYRGIALPAKLPHFLEGDPVGLARRFRCRVNPLGHALRGQRS